MFNWFQNVPNNTDGKKNCRINLFPWVKNVYFSRAGQKIAWPGGGGGGGEGAFFVLQATLFFAPLHLAACSQANRKIVLSFFSLNASKTNR